MTTISCADCVKATSRLWGQFTRSCRGCQARRIARSPAYFDSIKRGYPTEEYLHLCKANRIRHKEVKVWVAVEEVRKTCLSAAPR